MPYRHAIIEESNREHAMKKTERPSLLIGVMMGTIVCGIIIFIRAVSQVIGAPSNEASFLTDWRGFFANLAGTGISAGLISGAVARIYFLVAQMRASKAVEQASRSPKFVPHIDPEGKVYIPEDSKYYAVVGDAEGKLTCIPRIQKDTGDTDQWFNVRAGQLQREPHP